MDLEQDGVLGVGSERALRELLADKQPQRRVVVAVIDGGVDTANTLLASNLWRNEKDRNVDGKDDDNNGLVDDGLGWNYSVRPNGESVQYDTFELTRLYSACRGLPAGEGLDRPASGDCAALGRAFASKKQEIASTLGQIAGMKMAMDRATGTLRTALGTTNLTEAKVRTYRPPGVDEENARSVWLQLNANGIGEKDLDEAKAAYESQLRYGLDTTFNPHSLVEGRSGQTNSTYGNRDVMGPDAKHGTHVAGIIGARRDGGGSVIGIAPNVSLMAIRAVPDGDERDGDIANAIRYAADHGANIINMSFGKAYSPRKSAVDSAVRYAESKGILFVHAAGNDGANVDRSPSFPNASLTTGARVSGWLEIGASSWKGGAEIPANFSNYSKTRVDVFAPGVDILSTLPNGETGEESGTSMAAPVVSGVAALIMAYFPTLNAKEVRDILITSARNLGDLEVVGPGESGRVKFSALSRSGGVVDAFAAVKLAIEKTRPRP